MSVKLTSEEMRELSEYFEHYTNYEDEDPCAPIDPLTYRAPDGDGCIHSAARLGNVRAVELLLKGGVDLNSVGDMGYTALHLAYKKGHEELVRLLLEYGASTTIENEFGYLPSEEKDKKGNNSQKCKDRTYGKN